MRKRTWIVWSAALALVLAACTTGGGTEETAAPGDGAAVTEAPDDGGPAVAQRDYRFVVISHGQSSDPFWSVAANGVSDAAEDMGVTVEYQAPGTFDMAAMSQLIDAAVASNPDGIVVTIPDADALGPAIRAAVAAGRGAARAARPGVCPPPVPPPRPRAPGERTRPA
jgi:simple sugar transport system substrate-binding protein